MNGTDGLFVNGWASDAVRCRVGGVNGWLVDGGVMKYFILLTEGIYRRWNKSCFTSRL
jgi:hypothetical protein